MPDRRFRLLPLLALPLLLSRLAAAQAEPPIARFDGGEVSVSLVTVVSRIVDRSGAPIPDLKPEQVRVKIGGRRLPVAAVDYYDGSVSPSDLPDDRAPLRSDGTNEIRPLQVSARGQLFVFLVEPGAVDAAKTAVWKRMVEALKPADLAAVVALGKRCELQQDLTLDRAALLQAIVRGRQEDTASPPPTDPGALSLARAFRAPPEGASTERALTALADALDPLPGQKVVIFLAHGAGRFEPQTRRGPTAFEGAVRALQTARATVFALSEDLFTPPQLQDLAQSTGGTALKLHSDGKAIDRTMRLTRGYHLITLDLKELAQARSRSQPLQVVLVGRDGEAITEPILVVRAKAGARARRSG